jgi:hypothetical protein
MRDAGSQWPPTARATGDGARDDDDDDDGPTTLANHPNARGIWWPRSDTRLRRPTTPDEGLKSLTNTPNH